MLKVYVYNGKQFQFEEGEQPSGAVELVEGKPSGKAEEPETKAVKPANKARKAANK